MVGAKTNWEEPDPFDNTISKKGNVMSVKFDSHELVVSKMENKIQELSKLICMAASWLKSY